MAKEQFTTEELEHIEGKELPKTIHYHYICNQRSTAEELLLFAEKLIVLFLFLILLSAFAPSIFDFISDMWQSYANNNGFNGTAY